MNTNRTLAICCLTLVFIVSGSFRSLAAEEDALDQAEEQYNENKSNDKYKVICKREAPVGSRIKKKVCRTVAMHENTQREIKQSFARMRTSVSKNPGGG